MKTIDGRWGKISFFENDTYVGQSLANYGEYSPDEIETIIGLAQGLCLDVGANFGVITQALEKSGFECIAFEPQPDLFKFLMQNTQGLKYNCAVGSELGMAKMPLVLPDLGINYGALELGCESENGSIDVAVCTLDHFNFSNVGFIKIDVEGFEEDVLRGATNLIARCRPIMYIEDDREDKSDKLRSYIKSLDYKIEEHNPPLYRPNNFFNFKENIWKKNFVSRNLICIPNQAKEKQC